MRNEVVGMADPIELNELTTQESVDRFVRIALDQDKAMRHNDDATQ